VSIAHQRAQSTQRIGEMVSLLSRSQCTSSIKMLYCTVYCIHCVNVSYATYNPNSIHHSEILTAQCASRVSPCPSIINRSNTQPYCKISTGKDRNRRSKIHPVRCKQYVRLHTCLRLCVGLERRNELEPYTWNCAISVFVSTPQPARYE
jgi:hypothetical protein